MDENKFGLIAKTKKGYMDRLEGEDVHAVKSYAGHLFHLPEIVSVCVFNCKGDVPLYLRKNPDGTFYREERDL